MSTTFQSIRGMHDLLPDALPAWRRLETTVRAVVEAYGFREIRMPLLERTEVFTAAIGQATDVVEKEMYSFADRNGDSLSLRPEGTAGVVRAALQNGLLYGPTQRLWYSGPMFRHERPQKGRTRQFHQVGVEVFGPAGPDVDAELLALGERLWRRLGISGLRLELNTLGTVAERALYRERLVDYLGAHRDALDQASRERLERNPLRVLDSKNPEVQAVLAEAPLLHEHLGADSRRWFDRLRNLLDALGIEYHLNPRLVRGLDYYGHGVFEWVSGDLGAQGTVCAGGRYDGLVEIQGGKPWPATGFAMGMERLVELLRQQGEGPELVPHAYLVMVGEAAASAGLGLAERLRDDCPGLRLLSNAGGGSFKAQFKRADRSGARLALVLAEDELARDTVTVKHLREDLPQETIGRGTLAQWLQDWLD